MNLVDAINHVGPTVVQIRSQHHVYGSGFFVDEDAHVVTAWHVVESLSPILVGLAIQNSPTIRSNFSIVPADVAKYDKDLDVAVLRLQLNPFRGELGPPIVIDNQPVPVPVAVGVLDLGRPDDGEEIAISGYPLANPALITTAGVVASAWTTDDGFRDIYVADVQTNLETAAAQRTASTTA